MNYIFDDQMSLNFFKKDIFLISPLGIFTIFIASFIIGLINFFYQFLLCYDFLTNEIPFNGQPPQGPHLRYIYGVAPSLLIVEFTKMLHRT